MTKHYRGGVLREEDIKKMDENRKRPKLKEEENASLQV